MVRRGLITFFLCFAMFNGKTGRCDESISFLRLGWEGEKNQHCQAMTELFLDELRSIASDVQIELDSAQMDSSKNQPTQLNRLYLNFSCNPTEDAIVVKNEKTKESLSLKYQKRAGGFDSLDWVAFQKTFLRNKPGLSYPGLSYKDLAPQSASANKPNTLDSTISVEKPSIFKKWWFWAGALGVGASIIGGMAYLKSHGKTSVDVEIR